MAEQDSRDKDTLSNALYLAAQNPDGFTFRIDEGDKLQLALTGNGEVTLWISGNAQGLPDAAPSPAEVVEQTPGQEKERRTIVGNVASRPRYGNLPRRGLRVGFRFAEHIEVDGERRTTFHDAYATGKYAEAIQKAALEVGDEVAIHGEIQHSKVIKGGKERLQQQLYCYGVRVRKRAK